MKPKPQQERGPAQMRPDRQSSAPNWPWPDVHRPPDRPGRTYRAHPRLRFPASGRERSSHARIYTARACRRVLFAKSPCADNRHTRILPRFPAREFLRLRIGHRYDPDVTGKLCRLTARLANIFLLLQQETRQLNRQSAKTPRKQFFLGVLASWRLNLLLRKFLSIQTFNPACLLKLQSYTSQSVRSG